MSATPPPRNGAPVSRDLSSGGDGQGAAGVSSPAAVARRISVVVPSYNRAGLLPETLGRIVRQSVAPLEVIVVDDGSTDDTAAVVERFGPLCRSVRISNSGDLVARNAGVAHASGDLIAFCDSDDLWLPNFLEVMLGVWDLRPDTKVAYCDFRIVRDDVWSDDTKFATAPPHYWRGLVPLARGPYAVFEEPIVERVVSFQPFFASCVMARRDFLAECGGWDEGVGRTVGSDFATVLRFAAFAPFAVVNVPLAGIRKHAGNFSADVIRMQLGDSRVLEYVLANRPCSPAVRQAALASIAARRSNAFDLAFDRHDFQTALSILGQLPAQQRRNWRRRLKAVVARLPRPLAVALAWSLKGGSRLVLPRPADELDASPRVHPELAGMAVGAGERHR